MRAFIQIPGTLQFNQTGPAFNGESNLDLEYGISLVYPTKVTLYQVGSVAINASFNNLWISPFSTSDIRYPDGNHKLASALLTSITAHSILLKTESIRTRHVGHSSLLTSFRLHMPLYVLILLLVVRENFLIVTFLFFVE